MPAIFSRDKLCACRQAGVGVSSLLCSLFITKDRGIFFATLARVYMELKTLPFSAPI